MRARQWRRRGLCCVGFGGCGEGASGCWTWAGDERCHFIKHSVDDGAAIGDLDARVLAMWDGAGGAPSAVEGSREACALEGRGWAEHIGPSGCVS